ncbi:MAG: RSP_7527 family protein [Thalassobaculaceae bacterium]
MNMIHNQDFAIPAANAASPVGDAMSAGRLPSDKEIAAFHARAHQLRAAYLGQAVRGLWSALTHRFKEAQARNELAALPDHILRDIGLCRAEIAAAVAGDLSRQRHSEPAMVSAKPAPTTQQAEEKLAA